MRKHNRHGRSSTIADTLLDLAALLFVIAALVGLLV